MAFFSFLVLIMSIAHKNICIGSSACTAPSHLHLFFLLDSFASVHFFFTVLGNAYLFSYLLTNVVTDTFPAIRLKADERLTGSTASLCSFPVCIVLFFFSFFLTISCSIFKIINTDHLQMFET